MHVAPRHQSILSAGHNVYVRIKGSREDPANTEQTLVQILLNITRRAAGCGRGPVFRVRVSSM